MYTQMGLLFIVIKGKNVMARFILGSDFFYDHHVQTDTLQMISGVDILVEGFPEEETKKDPLGLLIELGKLILSPFESDGDIFSRHDGGIRSKRLAISRILNVMEQFPGHVPTGWDYISITSASNLRHNVRLWMDCFLREMKNTNNETELRGVYLLLKADMIKLYYKFK